MTTLLSRRALLILALAFCATLAAPLRSFAQQPSLYASAQAKNEDDFDLEVQIQLLIGSNAAGEGARVPASLDATLRQLRSTLSVSNYRMGATFLNRVKNGRSLEVKGTGGVLPVTPNLSPYTPSFHQFSLRPVTLTMNLAGQQVVNIQDFRFGLKVPISTTPPAPAGSTNPNAGFPVIQYEDTGISTGLSLPVGVPVVVGTLYFGPSGEAIIVVLTASKISSR
jgi:hypothetical protein